jgi:tetratricopeptide (TPR) repeat protein
MMSDVRASKWILLVLALIFIVPSCAGTKNRPSPNIPVQEPVQAATLARQHIDAGEYQQAINDYKSEYQNRPQDQALVKEYVKGLKDIKTAADKAVGEEDYASAGRIYDILLKNYAGFRDFSQELSFDKVRLTAKLSHCKKSLSAQGFQEYRKGNLGEAIALWQSLLAIDPDNADIKGAVKTAKLQQKNLQERSGGGR